MTACSDSIRHVLMYRVNWNISIYSLESWTWWANCLKHKLREETGKIKIELDLNLIRNILFLNCECRDAKGFLSLMLCFIRMNSFLTISNFISCTKGIMSLCYKLGFSNPYIFPTQFVYLTYFKLWILLDQIILARNVNFLHHQVAKKRDKKIWVWGKDSIPLL